MMAKPVLALESVAGPNVEPQPAKVSTESESGWQIKPRWRLQYDVAEIDGPDGLRGEGTFNAIRRARLGFDIKMPHGFSARIDGEVHADPPVLVDAYVGWKKDAVSVVVGQQKAVTPIDLHGSNLNTSFMERPSFYNAFNFGRGTGIMASFEKKNFGVHGAVYTDSLIQLNDVKGNSVSTGVRAYWSPKVKETYFHIAGSFNNRDLNDFAKVSTRYRQRPFVRITDQRYVGTPGLLVDSETRYGVEAAAVRKRAHFVGEVHWLEANRASASDLRFFGGYVEAGIFLTNDTRPLKGGYFGTIKPTKPVGSGGIGAVQVNVRYDRLDLNSDGITGGKQDGYLASVVWAPVEFVKLMVNYAKLDYTNAVVKVAGSGRYSVDVIGARFQISY